MEIQYNVSFRKGDCHDINSLELCRIRSIENCKIYTNKQLDIWKQSKPNWNELIKNTLICLEEESIVGFIVAKENVLDYLYVNPDYQNKGIGNYLVSLVEKDKMKCDCNSYSEKILKKRGWSFLSENNKENSGEIFRNKWYVFNNHKNFYVKNNESL